MSNRLPLFRTLGHGVSADALTTNAIVTLFAAGSVFSGAISLLVLGSTKSSDYGQLADLKTPLILGLIGGTLIAGIKLLGLFGLT